ncbi:hypothetical protein SLA2020_189720 [Shorea laevis]
MEQSGNKKAATISKDGEQQREEIGDPNQQDSASEFAQPQICRQRSKEGVSQKGKKKIRLSSMGSGRREVSSKLKTNKEMEQSGNNRAVTRCSHEEQQPEVLGGSNR